MFLLLFIAHAKPDGGIITHNAASNASANPHALVLPHCADCHPDAEERQAREVQTG